MTAIISFTLCLAGAVLLCVAMPRHWKALRPQRPHQTATARTLRLLGSGTLILAMAVPISVYGLSIGLVVFLGVFTVAQCVLAVALPYL